MGVPLTRVGQVTHDPALRPAPSGPSAFDMGQLFTQISGLRAQMGYIKPGEQVPDEDDEDNDGWHSE